MPQERNRCPNYPFMDTSLIVPVHTRGGTTTCGDGPDLFKHPPEMSVFVSFLSPLFSMCF